jgi:hypothetical protein
LGRSDAPCEFPSDLPLAGPAANHPASRPTKTRPGTSARIEVYRRRAELGLPLFLIGDFIDPEFFRHGKICYDVSPPANG